MFNPILGFSPAKWIATPVSIVVLLLASCVSTIKAGETTAPKVAFDGTKAYTHLVKQTGFGPRIPGSTALAQTRSLIKSTLESNGFKAGEHRFNAKSPLLNQHLEGLNIYGVYPPGGKVKFLVSAHYDCRPLADRDPDQNKRKHPVPGANDGASGVAALLELARVLPLNRPDKAVGLLFFDLEDHGSGGDASGFCLGSRSLAMHLPPELNFEFGINLDMIGDVDLSLPMEGYSLTKCPQFTNRLWSLGSSLYPSVFRQERGPSVYDDHMPFLGSGKQYIDIIDFEYASWHTTEDTADKCSAQSLEVVGDTILQFILN